MLVVKEYQPLEVGIFLVLGLEEKIQGSLKLKSEILNSPIVLYEGKNRRISKYKYNQES